MKLLRDHHVLFWLQVRGIHAELLTIVLAIAELLRYRDHFTGQVCGTGGTYFVMPMRSLRSIIHGKHFHVVPGGAGHQVRAQNDSCKYSPRRAIAFTRSSSGPTR